MMMTLWIALGVGLGLLASRLVVTTGEGTVVEVLLGGLGAVVAGRLFVALGGADPGFVSEIVYGAAAAVAGATIVLALYHAFLRHRMS